jgi:hypothetical protein
MHRSEESRPMTVYLHAKACCQEIGVPDETLLEAGIREELLRQIGRETKMFLFCLSSFLSRRLLAALSDAETGIVVTTDLGAMEYYETFRESILMNDAQPNAFKAAIPSFTASAAALQFGLKGPTITMIDQRPFSLKSLYQGQRLIESGWCDYVVAGGFSSASRTGDLLRYEAGSLTKGFWAVLLSRQRVLDGITSVDIVADSGVLVPVADISMLFPLFQPVEQ